MFGQDRNWFGEGLCIYVKQNIVPKQLNSRLDKETEAMYLKTSIRLKEWLLVGLYKPPNKSNSLFLKSMLKKIFQDI